MLLAEIPETAKGSRSWEEAHTNCMIIKNTKAHIFYSKLEPVGYMVINHDCIVWFETAKPWNP